MAQGAARAPADTDALLHHADVVRVIRAILMQFRLRDQDLEDGIADVQVRALATTEPGKRPTDVAGWKALVRKVAYNVGREKIKELCRRGKYNEGPTDGADDHAKSLRSLLEPHEDAKIRELVEQAISEAAAGPHTGAMLADMMAGAPPRETAKDTGMPASQMRKKTSKLRELMRNRLVQAGIGVAALLAVLGGGFAGYEHQEELNRQESFDANARPPRTWHRTVVWTRLELPPVDRAALLREEAAGECAAKDWERCQNELDMAEALDPPGEKLPEIRALRRTLNLEFEAKPRTR